jgi:hypothetical protein
MANNATGNAIFYLSGQAINEVDGDVAFEARLEAASERWSLGAFLADLRSCFALQPEAGQGLDHCLLCAMLGRALRTCKYHWIAGASAYFAALDLASDIVGRHWS